MNIKDSAANSTPLQTRAKAAKSLDVWQFPSPIRDAKGPEANGCNSFLERPFLHFTVQ